MKNFFKLSAFAAVFALTAQTGVASDKIGFADPGFLMQNHPLMLEAGEKISKFVQENESKFDEEGKKLKTEENALVKERAKLDEDGKKLQNEQKTVESSMKKKIAALEKEAPRLRSKDIQARQDKINAEGKAFQTKVEAFQKREEQFMKKAEAFQKKVQELQAKMDEAQKNATSFDPDLVEKQAVSEINETIKAVAEKRGYTLILPPSMAMYAKDEKADITDDILAELKAKTRPALETFKAPPAEVKPEAPADAKAEEVKK